MFKLAGYSTAIAFYRSSRYDTALSSAREAKLAIAVISAAKRRSGERDSAANACWAIRHVHVLWHSAAALAASQANSPHARMRASTAPSSGQCPALIWWWPEQTIRPAA
jgi:hypothetical protein